MNLLKKWWLWVLVAISILFLWQYLSGWAMSSKLYDMALDNLRQDLSKVVERDKEYIKDCENEVLRLQEKVTTTETEKIVYKLKSQKSETEVLRLRGEINDLQGKLDNIVVSNDPDRIVDDLNKLGYGPIRRIR
jgi:hypothetical protein